MDFMKNKRGFTLLEILASVAILSVVFLGITTLMVSGNNFFKSAQSRQMSGQLLMAMEFMERRLALANDAQIVQLSQTGDQIKARWDYGADFNVPLDTPDNTADDYFIKFAFISGKLYYRVDNTITANVTSLNNEVIPGLQIDMANSLFTVAAPLLTIKMKYAGANDTSVVYTQITARGMSN